MIKAAASPVTFSLPVALAQARTDTRSGGARGSGATVSPSAADSRELRLHEQDDEKLVEAFRRGEESAFEELVRRHRGRVYGTCYRYAGNTSDADDVAQDVFIRVYRGLARFRAESRFSTWLYRITVNACLNWVASRARGSEELPADLVDPSPSAAELLGREQRAAIVRRGIERLPDRQRMTLVLRVYEELSHKEIAALMDCTVGTAKANFFFALKNLRKHLEGRIERAELGSSRL